MGIPDCFWNVHVLVYIYTCSIFKLSLKQQITPAYTTAAAKGLEIFQAKLRGAAPSLCTVQSDYSRISSSFKMHHEIVLHSRSQHIPCPKLQARVPPQRHRKGSSKSFNLQQKNSREKFKSDQRTRKMQPLRIPARGPLHKRRGGGAKKKCLTNKHFKLIATRFHFLNSISCMSLHTAGDMRYIMLQRSIAYKLLCLDLQQLAR